MNNGLTQFLGAAMSHESCKRLGVGQCPESYWSVTEPTGKSGGETPECRWEKKRERVDGKEEEEGAFP